MGLSQESQIGKAGEHLVCCDLIMQGFNAFLADQGLLFDVLVEHDGVIKRMQVKTTTKIRKRTDSRKPPCAVYKFQTRRGRGNKSTIKAGEVDCYAFVAIDTRSVAYMSIGELTSEGGSIAQLVEFKSRRFPDLVSTTSDGKERLCNWGKYFEDFKTFKFA